MGSAKNEKKDMRNISNLTVAVVVSICNNYDAVRLCLNSLKKQTRVPDEVIVADDGSKNETRALVDDFKSLLPITHVWQRDLGFRKCLCLNKAFSICKSDYIIQIDGDIIVDRNFVADHISEAKVGYFLQGSRGKFNEKSTKRIFKQNDFIPHFYSKGLHRRSNTLRIPFLTPLFYKYDHTRGCNMSFWKKDIYAINGYDNQMIERVKEDSDLTNRLLRSGVKKRFLKFKAIEYHLWHRTFPLTESVHFDYNNEHNIVRVSNGLNEASLIE